MIQATPVIPVLVVSGTRPLACFHAPGFPAVFGLTVTEACFSKQPNGWWGLRVTALRCSTTDRNRATNTASRRLNSCARAA